MKKWGVTIATAAVAVWLVVDAAREFFANETIRYFSAEPQRLLYVAAIGIAGGVGALWFDWLSSRARRRVRVFAWGAAASTLTAFIGYFVFGLASFSSLVIESGSTVWMAVALLVSAGIAAYLWFEFYRELKTAVSK
ncbi:MAG: hypothetical protein WCS99_01855 [Limisphaerales bacterium]